MQTLITAFSRQLRRGPGTGMITLRGNFKCYIFSQEFIHGVLVSFKISLILRNEVKQGGTENYKTAERN